MGCFGKEMGEVKEWFMIEIYMFYCNLMVLIWYLVVNRCRKEVFNKVNTVNLRWHEPTIDQLVIEQRE